MRNPWYTCLGLIAGAVLVAACGGGSVILPPTAPTVTSIEPAGGAIVGGTPITIRGTGLTNSGVGLNEVEIGGVPALYVVVLSNTEITCVTPPSPTGASGAFDVTVTKNTGTGTATGGFTYNPAPTLSSISPAVGPPGGGLSVTLTGTGFTANNPGDNKVTIQGFDCTGIIVDSDTQIRCITPAGTSVAADVAVKNRNGTATLPAAFRFQIPPTITGVSPPAGPIAGNTLITISGTLFQTNAGTNTVTIDGAPCTSVTVLNDSILTCRTPMSPSGPGPKDVVVSNGNGTATAFAAFTYGTPPSLLSMTPTSGLEIGGGTATATGSDFQAVGAGTTVVKLGGTTVTSLSITNDTTLTFAIPAKAPGVYDLVITNDLGSATLPLAFTSIGVCRWDSSYGSSAGSGANSDDSYSLVTLGFTFPFYGSGQTSCYVFSNGGVAFGWATTSYYPSYPGELANKIITPLRGDLQPAGGGGGGTVYFKTDTSKAVVTYDQVYEWGSSNANTCQVQMFSDGRFCMLFKTLAANGASGVPFYVAASPGTSTTTAVNWNTLTSFYSVGSTQALWESFGAGLDLANSVIDFFPTGGGAYKVIYYALPP
jgi:hypothetical protein